MDQPHLIDGLDRITRALGGVTHSWRFDRMATVCHPDTGRVTASFAGVAKHYGVAVSICPPRAGHRKGVVEKINHSAAQRWWRTLADDVSVEQAQGGVDAFAATRGDTRMRAGHLDGAGRKVTVATVAKAESLRPPPAAAYPVILTDARVVSRQALVAYRGNRYSVPPELAGAHGRGDPPARRRGDRHRHQLGDRDRPPPARRRRHRRRCPRRRACHRPRGRLPSPRPPAATPGVRIAARNASHPAQPRSPPRPHYDQRHRGQMPYPAAHPGTDPVVSTVTDLAAYERAAHGRNTLT